MSVTDEVTVITGAGTGIGRATALLFAQRGAKLVFCGRDPGSLIETSSKATQMGADCMTCQVDVRDRLQVKDMAERVLERFGRVDILINNAGIALYKTILETTEEEWEDIIRTNMTGVFLCCKAVLPGMLKAKHGTIVNISSIAGIRGTSHMGAYSASKFAIIGLTQSLAKEIEPSGIKVYSVCPGPTDTKLHRLIVGDEAAKMAMSPEKVAETILGVITQEIPLPSGGEIVVDGQKIYRPFNTRNWSGSFKNRLKSLIYLGRE